MKGMPLLCAMILAVALAPVHTSFSQVTDSGSTLSVITTSESPYVYKDPRGHTVVVGQVENRNTLSSMSDIVVRAVFYGPSGQEVVETVRNGTVLDVVPPQGTSPYVITSASADPGIGQVSVNVETFNSSPTKQAGLELSAVDTVHNELLVITGSVRNEGGVPSEDTVVYLAFYDVFEPPRLLHVEQVPVGHIPIDAVSEFTFSAVPHPRAVSLEMFAESNILQSGFTKVRIPPQELVTSTVTISGLSITGPDGGITSGVAAGQTARIGSELGFRTVADDRLQPFVYYVQIRQSGGTPYVEFLGADEGSFYGTASESASVSWTPQQPGLYFVETFVWDRDAVPISSKGPVALVLVS